MTGPSNFRVRRDPKRTVPVENVMLPELESHHRRLERMGNADWWGRLFGAGTHIFLGVALGLAIPNGDWTTTGTLVCAGIAFGCGVAYLAVRNTEAESLGAITEDFRIDVIDSLTFEEVGGDQEGSAGP